MRFKTPADSATHNFTPTIKMTWFYCQRVYRRGVAAPPRFRRGFRASNPGPPGQGRDPLNPARGWRARASVRGFAPIIMSIVSCFCNRLFYGAFYVFNADFMICLSSVSRRASRYRSAMFFRSWAPVGAAIVLTAVRFYDFVYDQCSDVAGDFT